jgi:hypothetical protein
MGRQIVFLAAFIVVSAQAGAAERYRVTFTGTWTPASHPVDFPVGAHFSRLIGGTHNDQVTFWEPGGVASVGIQQMAELGGTSELQNEVNMAISGGTAGEVISGLGGIPSGTGVSSLEFSVTDEYPLVTLTTMIAPSPDWFVGVHGLSLRDENGWIGKTVVDLYAYDAGTDSGLTYDSANQVTAPRGTILRIDRPPLADHSPLANFSFLRLLDYDYSESGDWDAADIDLLSAAIRNGNGDLKYDVNGDQAVNDADRHAWISDIRRTCLGDANLDGVFTTADFVAVFTAGQYEDSITGNSTWATGDWNGDAEFDSSDFVAALQVNCYETVAATVPEPTTIASALIWIGALVAARKPDLLRKH